MVVLKVNISNGCNDLVGIGVDCSSPGTVDCQKNVNGEINVTFFVTYPFVFIFGYVLGYACELFLCVF